MRYFIENITDPFVFVPILIILLSICYFLTLPLTLKRKKERKKEVEYHKLNYKQFNRGIDAKNLNTAKDALFQLEYGYSEIKGHVNKNSASCYEEDIRDVRSNIDSLVEEKWSKKAEKILDDFLSTYYLITNPTFSDIEKAHRSKAKCLRQYDAYWEWTRQVHEENKRELYQLNLWNEAKQMFKDAFNDSAAEDRGIVNWGDGSTRQRIEKRLSDCIYAMQPEYKRKMELRGKILQKIRNAKTIQRSKLLSASYTGFVKAEVNACYKGLLHEMCVIETKQGNLYFVSLTEKGMQACPAKTSNATSKAPKPQKPKETVPSDVLSQRESSKPSPEVADDSTQGHDLYSSEIESIKQHIANFDSQMEAPRTLDRPSAITTIDQLLNYLSAHQIKWVDKREAGGCLWVESTPESDLLMKDIELAGIKFLQGRPKNHFNGNKGWFLPK